MPRVGLLFVQSVDAVSISLVNRYSTDLLRLLAVLGEIACLFLQKHHNNPDDPV